MPENWIVKRHGSSVLTRDEIAARLAAGHAEVAAICKGRYKGGRDWTMCVPVQDDDSDVVIGRALDTGAWLLAQADALAAALDALYTNTRSPEEWARRSPDAQAEAALADYRDTVK